MADSHDALSLLTAALSAQDAETEAKSLHQLLDLFQKQPGNLPPLFSSLLPLLDRGSETIKKWIVDVIDLTFCRPTLGPQGRSSLAIYMPDPILSLLNGMDLRYAKVAIMAFASVYQTLFRTVLMDRSQARLWPVIEAIKRRIVQLFDVPHHLGVKLAAIKAYQRIILVQTRAQQDAKAASSSKSAADTSVGQVPPDHPVLRVGQLEQEGNERLTQVVTVIFTSSNADLVMASMNSLALLAKTRPTLSPIVFEALVSWTPTALSSCAYTTIRSVEKTLRLLYQHFHPSRNSLAGQHATQIVEAIDAQKLRMETAAREEARRARERREEAERVAAMQASTASTSKRPIISNPPATGKRKRVRFAEGDDEESAHLSGGGHMPSRSTPPPEEVPEQPSDLLAAAIAALPALSMVYDTQSNADPMRIAPPDAMQSNPMAAFDATTLPSHLVTELVVANLQAIDHQRLMQTLESARQRVNGIAPNTQAPPAAPRGPAAMNRPPGPPPGPPPRAPAVKPEESEKEEPSVQDPLKLDMGEEETMEEAQRQLEEATAFERDEPITDDVDLDAFALRPPEELAEEDCKSLMSSSIGRICRNGMIAPYETSGGIEDAEGASVPPAQLWATLVTRLATRGLSTTSAVSTPDAEKGQDEGVVALRSQADIIRNLMIEFTASDLGQRLDFALQWMAEEYHCDLLQRKLSKHKAPEISSYSIWLQRLIEAVIAKMDSKDKSLHELLSRVPALPDGIIDTLQGLCLDKAKTAAGFTILRDLAITRIPARTKTCAILLGLARNEEKMVRVGSIITVRNWVRVNGQGQTPAGDLLEKNVLDYAKDGLTRLTVRNAASTNGHAQGESEGEAKNAAEEQEVGDDGEPLAKQGDEAFEEGAEEASPPSALDDPEAEITLESDVVRLVELPFSLCVRVADMLDEVFNAYPSMPPAVQILVEKHIKPLVTNLGPNHSKLLSLIQHHPPGSDSLAVCVFVTVTEKQRSKKIVDLVKQMSAEQPNIDARFLLPILPDLEKAEIIRLLPRVISLLTSEKPEDRATVKDVFTSIVVPPEQGFGSVSTNLPRVRQSELLSPVELMCLLHQADKDVGLKTAAEAIRICFGMTDIFRREVIGAVLNQLVEEPNLPVLFMRTAIMAVRTYKSLSSYISTIFLSRLITKKVWQQPLLWDGFVLCAKQTAPASFGALILLPREQLRDVISRQPDLRTGLREYLVRKAGGHRGRLASYLELLDEGGDGGPNGSAGTPSTAVPGDEANSANGGAGDSGSNTPDLAGTPQSSSGLAGAANTDGSTPQLMHTNPVAVPAGATEGQ